MIFKYAALKKYSPETNH